MNGMSVADVCLCIRAGRDHPGQHGFRRDAPDCQPTVRELGASSQSGPCCGFHKLRPNRQRAHSPVAYLNGSAQKAGEHLDSVATGGEAEPSPPQLDCRGTNLHSAAALTTVWSRLRPVDFRSTPLPSPACRMSQNCPPNPVSPARRCSYLARAGGNDHITEAHQLDGAAPLSGGFSRGGQHVASCIKVYVLRVSMKHQSKKSALKRGDVERRVRFPCPQKGGR